MQTPGVVIVGAGLAGLCCARTLHGAGVPYTIVEAGDAVGGRVRTDVVDGFRLDRGFQVLLAAYPECRSVLDYGALELRAFEPGAIVRIPGRFCKISDPWRRPGSAPRSLVSPVGTLGDKLRVGGLRATLRTRSLDAIASTPETTTVERLEGLGFTESMIERFFRPFLSGVFLDRELGTSSRMFEFVFKMFGAGDVVVPDRGMQAIPESLARDLPPGSVRLDTRVDRVEEVAESGSGWSVHANGARFEASHVVIATDGETSARLAGGDEPEARWNGTTCLYYDAPSPPIAAPSLVLNGEGRGPIGTLAVMSAIAPGYAPAGRALVSVSVLDDAEAKDGGSGGCASREDALESSVRTHLGEWFGDGVDSWRHLRTYTIPHALPRQPPGVLEPWERPVRRRAGLYVCGDHVDQGSIQGAMVSGRRAAEAILEDAPS